MNRFFKWGRRSEADLSGLELSLQDILHPVTPRPEFIKDLKRQLLSRAELDPSPVKKDLTQYTLLAVAGLFSGTVLVVLGIRALVALLGALGIAQQVKSQMEQKKPPQLTPVL